METVFTQIGPWLFMLTLGSGMGVPLGIPPGPDDPVISRVAPGRLRLLHHMGGHRNGRPSQQESGRTVARRTRGAVVSRTPGEMGPARDQPIGAGTRGQ